jgi:hypothetical protein
MTMRQRRKGKTGELDLVHWLAKHDIYAERGAQHRGGPHSPDVVIPDWPWLHIEAKRVEHMDLGSAALELAMQQSEQDKGPGQVPVVFWRPSRKPWRMTLRQAITQDGWTTPADCRVEAVAWGKILVTFCDGDAITMLRGLAEVRR